MRSSRRLRRRARLELFFHQPRDVLQHPELRGAEAARLVVDNAERADARAVGGVERNAGIEAHVRIADDDGIVGEAIVLQRVVHDERLVFQDGVRAEADVARAFR